MTTTEKRYPETITEDVLAKNAHIPDAEIQRDIAETEAEIAASERLLPSLREYADNLPYGHADKRMAHFKADAKAQGIGQRREFVTFLKRLLAAREAPDAE